MATYGTPNSTFIWAHLTVHSYGHT